MYVRSVCEIEESFLFRGAALMLLLFAQDSKYFSPNRAEVRTSTRYNFALYCIALYYVMLSYLSKETFPKSIKMTRALSPQQQATSPHISFPLLHDFFSYSKGGILISALHANTPKLPGYFRLTSQEIVQTINTYCKTWLDFLSERSSFSYTLNGAMLYDKRKVVVQYKWH